VPWTILLLTTIYQHFNTTKSQKVVAHRVHGATKKFVVESIYKKSFIERTKNGF